MPRPPTELRQMEAEERRRASSACRSGVSRSFGRGSIRTLGSSPLGKSNEPEKVSRKACTGPNPQTAETIQVPAQTVVQSRVAKAIKDAAVPPEKK